MIRFEYATPALLRSYWEHEPPFTLRGYVAINDAGEVVGVGGCYFNNKQVVAFSEAKPDTMGLKDRARATRLLEKLIKTYKCPVMAVATLPTSVPLLTKLGFEMTTAMVGDHPLMRRLPDEQV